MTRFARHALGSALFGVLATSAHATLVFGPSGEYAITSVVTENLVLRDGATVRVESGGVVASPGSDVWAGGLGHTAVVAQGAGNVLEVTGSGRIIAHPDDDQAIATVFSGLTVRLVDDAYVSGGIAGDYSPGWQDEATAAQRLYVADRAVVDGSIHLPGYVELSDQALILGDIGSAYGGDVNVSIQGGVVTGSLRLGGAVSHRADISGGAILGGVQNYASDVQFQMTGGYLGGAGIETFGSLQGEILDGRIDGGVRIRSSWFSGYTDFAIMGGVIDAGSDEWLFDLSTNTHNQVFSSFEIWGGQLGYSAVGNGIRLDQFINFDVYGWGLSYTDDMLSGYLADGNWFSSPVTIGDNWRGELRVHDVQVPEPETLPLLSLGLLISVVARKRLIARSATKH